MEILPRSKRERGIVVALLLVLTAILVLVRVFLSPDTQSVAKDLADSTISTILVTLIVAMLIRSLDLHSRYALESRILYPSEIGGLLLENAKSAETWEYRGGCGRFQRSTVLPELAASAKSSGKARYAQIEVLDPNNEGLCVKYAEYRNKRRSGKGDWDVSRVRREVLSTIFSAHNHSKRDNIEVSVYLASNFSLFRVDLSNSFAVITQEDDRLPALKLASNSHYFRQMEEDLRVSRSTARCIRLDAVSHVVDSRESLEGAAQKLGLDIGWLDAAGIDLIIKMIAAPEAPYV